jgi:hypothetical protein
VGSPAELAKSDGIYAQLLAINQEKDESAKKRLKAFEIAA